MVTATPDADVYNIYNNVTNKLAEDVNINIG